MLTADPADPDAAAGVALVGLYQRTMPADEPVDPAADDLEARSLLADFAALRNDWPTAFDTAIGVVRLAAGDEREAARTRVVEYFLLAGDDPSVPKARSALANALF